MKQTAIYPGTFDPVSYGHLDLIKRAAAVFDQVIVAVAKVRMRQKNVLFTCEERVDMLKATTKGIKNIKIIPFDGLLVNVAKKYNAKVLIRGLRVISDFEYELQMALTNRRLDKNIETMFLMPSENHYFLSSSLIKEAAALNADISSFVPKYVAKKLKERLP